MNLTPKHVILGAVVAIIAGVLIVPGLLGPEPAGTRKTSGTVISQTIGAVKTDAEAAYAITLQEGNDALHESDHVFEALAGLPGVGKASFDTATLQLVVAYDSAATVEERIRERLVMSGYSAPTAADATPTEIATDGSVQRLSIADQNGFDPALILAKAGIPIELTFAPGQECRATVVFPEINVTQDISQGGVVSIAGLTPGTYTIQCGGGSPEGTLIVE